MGKHLLTFFVLPLGSQGLLLFFKQCFSLVFLLFVFIVGFAEHTVNEDSKIVVKYSSERAQNNQSFCIKQQ